MGLEAASETDDVYRCIISSKGSLIFHVLFMPPLKEDPFHSFHVGSKLLDSGCALLEVT